MERYYSDSPKVDFDHAPEMAPYLEQPDAMYVGCPGKHGYLNLGFELDADGKSIMRELDRRAPLIVQREAPMSTATAMCRTLPCIKTHSRT